MDRNKTHRRLAPPRLAFPPPLDFNRDALFLDLDGTLLEIAQRPDMVEGDAVLRGLLRELHSRLGGALAIISGRAISDVDRILGAETPHVSGVHGQHHRIGGELQQSHHSASIEAAAEKLRELNASDLLRVLVEHKGAALAVHYREAPEHAPLVKRVADEIAERHGLKVMQGRMVVEFLPPDASKSDAVAFFMKTPAFAGRLPVAVGDDVTDEDAFMTARALNGAGIQVGEARHTSAKYRLANVGAVRSWLLGSLGRALT